jgi:hypothetical protein
VLCDLGRYEAAAEHLGRRDTVGRLELEAVVAGGDPTLGARVLRAMADEEGRTLERETNDGAVSLAIARREGYGCMADALDARGGDDAARRRLTERAEAGNPFCRLLLADVTEGEARLPILDGLEHATLDIRNLVVLLRAEVAPGDAASRPDEWRVISRMPLIVPDPDTPTAVLAQASAAVEDASGARPEDRALRAFLRGLRGREQVSLGRADAAEPLLQEAVGRLGVAIAELESEVPARDEATSLAYREVHEELGTWWAIAAAERGDLEEAERRIAALVHDEQRRTETRDRLLAEYRLDDAELGGVPERRGRALREGDGREVAIALGQPAAWEWTLPPAVHRITRGREALASHLRYGRRITDWCEPFDTLRTTVASLRVARGLGAEDWRRKLDEEVRARHEALTRREVAVLLYALRRHLYVHDGR